MYSTADAIIASDCGSAVGVDLAILARLADAHFQHSLELAQRAREARAHFLVADASVTAVPIR